MRVAHRTVGPLLLRRLRAEVVGTGHVPWAGPVVIAANHVSYLDNYVISAACPRPPCFLGKAELAEGLFGRFNQAMGMVPIDRGSGDRDALGIAEELLEAGEVVALFPEGTRSPTGALYQFRSGMARLAAAQRAPVVPAAVRGSAQVWPPGAKPSPRRPPARTLSVAFGAPFTPPEDTPRARRAFTTAVRAAVAELSGQPLMAGFAPVIEPSADAGG